MTAPAPEGGGPHEAAALAIWDAEYLIIVAGPSFTEDSGRSPYMSEFCDIGVASKPNKFMGFWGKHFNDYMDRQPHDGYQILGKWREKFFDVRGDDARRRQARKKGEGEEGTGIAAAPVSRCVAITTGCDNLFQKTGFPAEDVNDMWGNISQWQCSRVPPCCQKVWNLDRHFRFVVDSANHEAAPIKYESDKRDTRSHITWTPCDSDEERDEGFVPTMGKARLGWLDRATVIRQPRAFQMKPDSYVDAFEGFVTSVGAMPETFGFPVVQDADGSSDRIDAMDVEASMMSRTGLLAVSESVDGSTITMAGPPCPAPLRSSHLYAHIEALDVRAYTYQEGQYRLMDTDLVAKERRNYNARAEKGFDANLPHIAYKRQKYIWYNVSVVFVTDDPNSEFKANVIDPRRVHPHREDPTSLIYATDSTWSQGAHGRYYFSHVKAQNTMREPLYQRDYDIVEIPFPKGSDSFRVPTKGRVSVVVETVVWDAERGRSDPDKGGAKGGAAIPPPPADGCVNPLTYITNVWQVVGRISAATPSQCLAVEGEGPQLEYSVRTRRNHAVKFCTTRKGNMGQITSLVIEVPCDERDAFASPLVHGAMSVRNDPTRAPELTTTTLQRQKDEKVRPPHPVPNHQMCLTCHDIARPHVLMSRPGKKDDGLCATNVGQKSKQFKNWEKSMLEAIKADTSRAIVILEMGCEKRTEPCKTYSEKMFKQTKSNKSTFVRISPQNIDTGKAKAEKVANEVIIEDNVIHALITIDKLIVEKLRKMQRGGN